MAEEKKTQIGTTPGRTVRPTGSPSVAAGTPAPVDTHALTDPHGGSVSPKAKTSYLTDVPDPLLGSTVAGRYKIIRKLGEGGMGSVYLALHMVLEKQVALKVLHGEFARKQDLVERFMQEAKAASRIRHENVIDISDFGATPEGVVFFAMELLNGHDLHDEIARAKLAGNLLPWARTKKIFLQVCSALSAAHARGIIHRDLKPENIYLVDFLGDHDFVKLLDFGIAKVTDVGNSDDPGGSRKLTKTGMLFGTPEYMSPEQARGEAVDSRVDIYAMGCILFQMLTNQVPFMAENFMGVLSQHLTEEPPEISPVVLDQIGAPRAIAAIVDKALVKDPNSRYQTIDEMAAAIREACGDAPLADRSGKMRVASVPSPGETTRMRPPTGPVQPGSTSTLPRAKTPTARTKTEWTGNLAVPDLADDAPPPPASNTKLPMIIAGVVVLVAGAAGAIFLLGRDKGPEPAPTVAAGSDIAASPPTPPAPVETPPAPPPVPAQVSITFTSEPKGAQIVDGSDPTLVWGKTPTTFSVPGSATARRFKFVLKGYGDSIVELVPNQPSINFSQKLTKGPTKANAVTRVPDAAAGVAGAVTRPDAGTTGAVTTPVTVAPPTPPTVTPPAPPTEGSAAAATPPVETKPETKPETKTETAPETKPDPKPDTKPAGDSGCTDEPCLKSDPSRAPDPK